MKKEELLNYFDDELLDKLFGYCYARTNDSYEAQELCSDIIFALVKAAHTDGEITSIYPFIWRVARNVYADFSKNRRKNADIYYEGNADDVLQFMAAPEQTDDSDELLTAIYRRIAFLTKAYREVMIMYYIDGLTTGEIAKKQNTSEVAIRQRLFSARQKVKSEVTEMSETYNKPLALDKKEYHILGTGNPAWGDPRTTCNRTFSEHILWLCRKKAMSAAEIAEQLNVPTMYVEEELEILTYGENGSYGLLRKLENGKYIINFILLDEDTMEKATAIYTDHLPKICDTISDFVNEHKEEYLSFPYLNKKVDFNLILWQQVTTMSYIFSEMVEDVLAENYFADTSAPDRPFSVFGHVSTGKTYGAGWDGAGAENVCGFSKVHLENIYITRIKAHFHCGLNVGNDPQIQLALRAINGLDVNSMSEAEKEHAAKAIDCGYLYREKDMLYTKILVSTIKDSERLFAISCGLYKGYFHEEAKVVAKQLAALIKQAVPDYLLGEWRLANRLADLPVLDAVVEALIERGLLTPPEDGIGAEGCWMSVEK